MPSPPLSTHDHSDTPLGKGGGTEAGNMCRNNENSAQLMHITRDPPQRFFSCGKGCQIQNATRQLLSRAFFFESEFNPGWQDIIDSNGKQQGQVTSAKERDFP